MKRPVVINVSNFCFSDLSSIPSALPFLLQSPEGLAEMVLATGADGFQYTPFGVHGFMFRKGWGVSTSFLKHMLAVEQSFRGERTIHEALKHKSPLSALGAMAIFPHRDDSVGHLKIAQDLRDNLYAVIYPPEDNDPFSTRMSLANKLCQPAPELIELWGLDTETYENGTRMVEYNVFEQAVLQRNMRICLDTAHMRRNYGEYHFDSFDIVMPQAIGSRFTRMVHIRFLAPNEHAYMTGIGIGELAQFMSDITSSSISTPVARTLVEIKRVNWTGPIVIEIPLGTLMQYAGIRHASPKKVVELYKPIIERVRSYLR